MNLSQILLAYNSLSHAVLIVLIVYIVMQQQRQDKRTDALEREIGYGRGYRNGERHMQRE